jgi:cytochrome d ubiquinol oxidase subunit II
MSVFAYAVLAVMITTYVILDGYDLGIGAVLHAYGRTQTQRGNAMESIGPFWNGNEVWLIASGGALFALFPRAYAVSFSGFYLPLMVALWLLMGRGIALELRHQLDGEMWREFWDWTFSISSALLALIFGVALGNLIRGLPIDADGYFNGSFALLLNPFALGVGLLALVALAYHGLGWLNLRLPAGRERGLMLQSRLWWVLFGGDILLTAATAFVHPLSGPRLIAAGILFVVSIGSLIASKQFADRRAPGASFAASSAFLGSLLVAAAGTIYPYIVPAIDPARGLSIFDFQPNPATLAALLIVLLFGLTAVVIYTLLVTRKMLRETSATAPYP